MLISKLKIINNAIINFAFILMPKTRWFKLKANLLIFFGHKINKKARITGNIKIYGRGKISVGDDTWIGIGCIFYTSESSNIYVGDNCDIAPQVTFHTGTHSVGSKYRRAGVGISEDIVIENGSWIGVNSTLLAGCHISSGCIIAAGSVVIKNNYSSNNLYGGVPAKFIRTLEETSKN